MREIKFRAWNGSEMFSDVGVTPSSDGSTPYVINGAEYDNIDYLPEAILMQYAGIKDKNGVEIYEGDILRHPYMTDEDDPAEPDVGYLGSESVKYAVGEVKISPYLGSYLKLRSGSTRRVTRHRVTGGEVIGNVHEHGHLMEVTL